MLHRTNRTLVQTTCALLVSGGLVSGGLVSGGLVSGGLVSGVPASADVQPMCQGKPATVVGHQGTEGDDVMVVPLLANGGAFGGAGNDVICLVDNPPGSSRDPMFVVDAGPGDDSVVNETTHDISWTTFVLGPGSDRFVGHDHSELVFAGDSPVYPGAPLDVDRDAISTGGGDDRINSGAGAAGAANDDVIETGSGEDWVSYHGLMSPTGSLDNGPGADLLVLTAVGAPESIVFDARTGTASANGATVLRWSSVRAFDLNGLDSSSVSFIGSDRDEGLFVGTPNFGPPATVARDMSIDLAMGGGDDSVTLAGRMTGRLDGGTGTDRVHVRACTSVELRLASRSVCTWAGDTRAARLAGLEAAGVSADGDVLVVGTTRADDLIASGHRIVMKGRAGADHLVVDDDLKDDGHFTILGGRGRDVMLGSEYADRLIGGRGRDRANGRENRDYCVAEIRRNCERPR